MKKQQHISMKHINGSNIFRVHDVINDELVNLRAVKETENGFEVMMEFTHDEHEFVFSEEDIHLYSGSAEAAVREALHKQERAVERYMRKIMKATAYVNTETMDIRTVAGHTYFITEDERGVGVPRIDYGFGAPDGRVVNYGPVPEDMSLNALVLELVERPYQEERYFQTGPSEYMVLSTHKGIVVCVPLFLHREEGGELAWASDSGYFRYIMNTKNGAELIQKPETIFPKVEDAQSFLEEVTKEATERILKAHPSN